MLGGRRALSMLCSWLWDTSRKSSRVRCSTPLSCSREHLRCRWDQNEQVPCGALCVIPQSVAQLQRGRHHYLTTRPSLH